MSSTTPCTTGICPNGINGVSWSIIGPIVAIGFSIMVSLCCCLFCNFCRNRNKTSTGGTTVNGTGGTAAPITNVRVVREVLPPVVLPDNSYDPLYSRPSLLPPQSMAPASFFRPGSYYSPQMMDGGYSLGYPQNSFMGGPWGGGFGGGGSPYGASPFGASPYAANPYLTM